MIQLRVMGEAVVQAPSGRLVPSAPRVFALALLLSLDRSHPWERDDLARLIWPDSEIEKARHNLRQGLYRLRRVGFAVRATADRVALSTETDVRTDELSATEPIGPLAESLVTGTRAVGPFLGSYDPTFSLGLRDWVDEQRTHAHARLRTVLAHCLEHFRRNARWASAEQVALRLLQYDPLNEAATLALAEVAALSGDKVRAVRMLERYTEEVGKASADLTIAPTLLRRRVSEALLPRSTIDPTTIPLVGREAESAVVMAAIHHTKNSSHADTHYRIIIQARPGFGKTRLVEEAHALSQLAGVRQVRAAADPSSESHPLGIAIPLARQLLELPGALGCSPESIALLRHITSTGHSNLGDGDERHGTTRLDPIEDALIELFHAVATEIPLLVSVDDAHWLSARCTRVLHRCMTDTAIPRTCFVIASRDFEIHDTPWASVPWSALLRLDELPEESCRQLARYALGDRATEEREDWIVSSAGGNPLFIRLLADSIVETGQVSIPHSMAAVIRGRLLQCSPKTIRLLQTIALAAPYGDLDTIESASQLEVEELRSAIEEAERCGLLGWTGSRVVIRHSLISDAILNTLGDAGRALSHRAIASALEDLLGTQESIELAWYCTHHWMGAGDYDRAITAARRCTLLFVRAGLTEEAVALACKVLANSTDEAVRSSIVRSLLQALDSAGRWDEILQLAPTLTQGMPASIVDMFRLASIHAQYRLTGDAKAALQHLTTFAEDPRHAASARVDAAEFGLRVSEITGEAVAAMALYSSVFGVLESTRERRPALTCSIVYNTAYGDLELALVDANRMLALSEHAADHAALCRALRFRATVLQRIGDIDSAKADLLRCWQVNELMDSRFVLIVTAVRLLEMSLDHGWDDEAGRYYAELAPPESLPVDKVTRSAHSCTRARYLLASGKAEEALRVLEAHALSNLSDQPLRHAAAIQAVRGLAHLELGENGGAQTALKQLEEAFPRLASVGGFDYCAAAMQVIGSNTQPDRPTIWRAYTAVRRERGAVGTGIVRLLNSDSSRTQYIAAR